ncbi:phosphatase PAP2 family protein [Streptomyces sp. NPDC057638]|uniref:phosphatase PAP2 family protein n=1 Tax=Streptomyces sp. NPDC057638 TaxID=3346190 RepID=UPI0036A6B5BA
MSRPRPTTAPTSDRAWRLPARVGAALGALSALLLVLVVVAWSPLISFDRSLARALHRKAVEQPGLVQANRVLTDWFWDPWTMRALVAVAVVWLLWRREVALAVWAAVTTALGTALQTGLKSWVGRERPVWPDPVDSANLAALPSGHAMSATFCCGVLLWLLRRHGVTGPAWRLAVAVAVVSVAGAGLTRIYLGVHWPTDVLAGWLMGACWVVLAIAVYERAAAHRHGERLRVGSGAGGT